MSQYGFPAMRLRSATPADLPAINHIIERAIETWPVPARVKRVSLPLYSYRSSDFEYQDLVVADDGDAIVGIAAWEDATPGDLPHGYCGLLLHGIYVDPAAQRRGIGSDLLAAARRAAARRGLDGVLVKAQPTAIPFFEARGLERLAVTQPQRDYPYRYWLPAYDAAAQPARDCA